MTKLGLGHGRHVRQHRPARRAGEGKWTQLARLNVRQRQRRSDEHHLNLPADQIGDGGARATIRNMGQLDSGARLEQFAGKVKRVADAGRAVSEATVRRARERDKPPAPSLPVPTG
jgi:hypothetical protein